MKKNISFYYGYDSDYKTRVGLIKEVGFDGIMAMFENEPDFYPSVEYAMAAGLNVDSIHMPFEGIVNDIWMEGERGDKFVSLMKRGADYARQIGVDKLTVHISSSHTPPPLSKLGLKRLEEIEEYYKATGRTLCIENLRRIDYFERVTERLPSARVCYDTGHHNAYYRDYDFTPYADRIITLHVHDNVGLRDDHYLPFEGTLDWDKVAMDIGKMKNVRALTLETLGARHKERYQTELDFLRGGMEALDRLEEKIKRYANE